jgi:hypothetical protein
VTGVSKEYRFPVGVLGGVMVVVDRVEIEKTVLVTISQVET